MKRKVLLLLIILFNLFLKFWRLGVIPPLLDKNELSLRFLSAGLSLFFPVLIYILVRNIYRADKLALLTALIFTILPQTIVEGRIVSILVYPPFLLKNLPGSITIYNFTSNLLSLISFDMLFFKNTTFYWGGIREFGMMYLSFLPFFLLGLYQTIHDKKFMPLIALLLIFVYVSLIPSFPESRIVLLAAPLLSFIVARGTLVFWQYKNINFKLAFFLLVLFLFYELIQFFHYYTMHYPVELMSFKENIARPF